MTRRGWRGERGMVTAETALALPALVVVLGGLLSVVLAVTAQLRCVAAAREGARAAARGEPPAVVRQAALQAAPDGAAVEVGGAADTVTVTVTALLHPLGLRVAVVRVEGSATARREPTASDPPPATGAGAALAVGTLAARRRSPPRGGPERGSGTLYAAAAIGVLAALTAGVLLLARAHVARSRAEAAADLAALAAAQQLVAGTGDPCAAAAGIAVRNHASLAGCTVDGETVVVTAAVSVDLGGLGVLTATGRARAGPVPEPGSAG